MKHSIFLLLFLSAIFSSITIYGQSKKDNNPVLAGIRNVFAQINSYKSYTLVTITDAEEFLNAAPDNGASLTGYYKGDSLKKIIEWIGLSNKAVQNEYYFDKGKLVFIYAKEIQYGYNDSTESVDHTKQYLVFEGRYYFAGDKLIEVLVRDKEQEKKKEKEAADLLMVARNYTVLLDKNRKQH